MAINDGGPAFPMAENHYIGRYDREGDLIEKEESLAIDEDAAWPGMTLRDYFAAKAMPIVCLELRKETGKEKGHGPTWPQAAEWAYQFADAMLAERKEAAEE